MSNSSGIVRAAGEGVGNFLAGIPPALIDFVSGIAAGAGLHGVLDWAAMILGLGLLLSTVRGLRRKRIVGPMIGGTIGVALMGWAIARALRAIGPGVGGTGGLKSACATKSLPLSRPNQS